MYIGRMRFIQSCFIVKKSLLKIYRSAIGIIIHNTLKNIDKLTELVYDHKHIELQNRNET